MNHETRVNVQLSAALSLMVIGLIYVCANRVPAALGFFVVGAWLCAAATRR